VGAIVVHHQHQRIVGAGQVEHRIDDVLREHLGVGFGDFGLQPAQRVIHPILRLHFGQQGEPHRDQLPGTQESFGVVFLDGIRGLDQVVRENLELEGEFGKFFHGVGRELHRGADDGADLHLLLIAHRRKEVADAGLADPHCLLAPLEEIRVVVEGAGLAFLEQAAVARIFFDRREGVCLEIEDLELESGGGLEAIHHPGKLGAADQRAELPFLRFWLHDAVRPLKVWVDLPGNNGLTPQNLLRVTHRRPEFRLNSGAPFPQGHSRQGRGRATATLGAVLSTRLLSKRYGSLTAVEDLDLEVSAGELFGFLGPNGAGKTTTIKMLVGLLRPTSGSARVAGIDIAAEPERAKAKIGYVPDAATLYDKLSAREFLEFSGDLYHVEPRLRDRRIEALLKLFDLRERSNDFLSGYSRGMRQKVSLAAALLHDPQVLFLDEPTVGLDP